MICGAFTEIQASSDSDRSSDEWDVWAREAQTWFPILVQTKGSNLDIPVT